MEKTKKKRLVIEGIDEELRQWFRIHCLKQGTSMSEAIIEHLRRLQAKEAEHEDRP